MRVCQSCLAEFCQPGAIHCRGCSLRKEQPKGKAAQQNSWESLFREPADDEPETLP